MNRVRQRAVLFKFGEREQQLFHVVRQAGGQESARADEGITAPIQKPRITGNDRFTVVAADDELFRGGIQLGGEGGGGIIRMRNDRCQNGGRVVCFRRG